jgi:anti-sigma B factor antagonist
VDRPELICDVQQRGDEVVVVVRGELDLNSGDVLQGAAQRALVPPPIRVVLDFAHLVFCDSTGLSVLVRLRDRAEQAGSRMVIDRPHAIVARLLAATGLDAVLEIQTGEGAEPAIG